MLRRFHHNSCRATFPRLPQLPGSKGSLHHRSIAKRHFRTHPIVSWPNRGSRSQAPAQSRTHEPSRRRADRGSVRRSGFQLLAARKPTCPSRIVGSLDAPPILGTGTVRRVLSAGGSCLAVPRSVRGSSEGTQEGRCEHSRRLWSGPGHRCRNLALGAERRSGVLGAARRPSC